MKLCPILATVCVHNACFHGIHRHHTVTQYCQDYLYVTILTKFEPAHATHFIRPHTFLNVGVLTDILEIFPSRFT